MAFGVVIATMLTVAAMAFGVMIAFAIIGLESLSSWISSRR
jgi:hypothetical protein